MCITLLALRLLSCACSNQLADLEIAKSYIEQLVWLISYPNIRVQFQSAWGIANLALGKRHTANSYLVFLRYLPFI
jgi:hypothetical protein